MTARRTRRRAALWLARQLRRLERHLDPLPRPPAVVEDGYAQGRADLQLVHAAAHADLRSRADRISADAAARWNQLAARSWQRRP